MANDKWSEREMIDSGRPLRTASLLALALVMAVSLAGCSTTGAGPDDSTTVAPDSEFREGPPATNVSNTNVRNEVGFSLGTVYFDFDKATINQDARVVLDSAGADIRDSGQTIMIAGHADEVGSDEYNLALGERRANAVRVYLYNIGVGDGQMQIISYGESRPAVGGTGEAVWRLNRRAEINPAP